MGSLASTNRQTNYDFFFFFCGTHKEHCLRSTQNEMRMINTQRYVGNTYSRNS